MSAAPTDRELIDGLGGEIDGHAIESIRRRPYSYATSAPLEEVQLRTAGGEEVAMILKDLDRDRLLGDARTSKPPLLYEPRREVETYRRIIGPAGIGPRCYAAAAGGTADRHWLLIEKVPGVELWQIGELEVWQDTARWLGGMHARFRGRDTELLGANPHLVEHTREWYEAWAERALDAVERSADARGPALRAALGAYREVADALAELPRTLVHGELYPSNVLIVRERDSTGVYPVDWEMAAVGPGVIDLASMVAGWDETERRRLIATYAEGLAHGAEGPSDEAELFAALARGRLHLALQWLGWAEGWSPPPEHARDWLGEALAAAGELGLA